MSTLKRCDFIVFQVLIDQVLPTAFPSLATEAPRVANVAAYLPLMARTVPNQPALIVPPRTLRSGSTAPESLTFAELEGLTNRMANGLSEIGITRGMHVLVMLRPGVDFVGIIFALFKMGAVPVMIDPGMGIRRMLECIQQIEVHALIGIPPAHAIRILRRGSFRSLKHHVTVGKRWFWGGPTLDEITGSGSDLFEMAEETPTDPAAILFTSGSTGPAKGVVYEHGMFGAQVEMIQSYYGIQPGEIDLPAFPLFALFSTAMGMTAVIPDVNPSRPATVDPESFVRTINEYRVTNTFGSPAIWNKVSRFCVENGVTLPSIRRILIAGAPVPFQVIERLHRVIPADADVHTPYGATEALPVTSIAGRELSSDLQELTRRGAGTCVGRELPGIELRFIRLSDDPIAKWSEDLVVRDGEIGELVVAGRVVTKEYQNMPRATDLAKIADGDRVWHRMGDLGYRDKDGRIWFCGRKSHRVRTGRGTMYTDRCEPIFNEHPAVSRSALVGVGPPGAQRPIIVIEPAEGRLPNHQRALALATELVAIAKTHPPTAEIKTVLFHPRLPVDVRHNAKINREQLVDWAARKLK